MTRYRTPKKLPDDERHILQSALDSGLSYSSAMSRVQVYRKKKNLRWYADHLVKAGSRVDFMNWDCPCELL